MTNSDNSLKKRSIVFRFQPMDETPDSILLDYLKSTDAPNELALRAMRMCWLAYAYQHSGTSKGQQLKKVAQEMIWVLEGHIEELRAAFGVERPQPPTYAYPTNQPAAETKSSLKEDEEELEIPEGYANVVGLHFNTAGL